ncbi:MAG TPA: hypothetical protein P5519_06265 [Spirochaetia bacterium]|nr:hypothetical protein [Spirochaetales bacterium]HRS65476.1 hypothetical protein [Spirochaetia bacterium]HRV29533.1 hypothetical protein [Spirochaetia bacterium]
MFIISIYIDYYYQIQRCRAQKYDAFFKDLQNIISDYGMIPEQKREHPLNFTYSESGPFAFFQLACFLESLDQCFIKYRKLFTTITVYIDSSATPEIEHEHAWEKSRYTLNPSPRYFATKDILQKLKPYIEMGNSNTIISPVILSVRKHIAMQYASNIMPYCIPEDNLETVITEIECSTTPVLVLKLTSLLQNPAQALACITEKKGRKPLAILCNDRYSLQVTTPFDTFSLKEDEESETVYHQKLKANSNNFSMLLAGISMSQKLLFLTSLPEWIESSCEHIIRFILEKRVTESLDSGCTPWFICNASRPISDFGADFITAWISDATIQHLGKTLIITSAELPKGISFENSRIITATINYDSINTIIEKALGNITDTDRSILKNWFMLLLTQGYKNFIPKKRVEQLLSLAPKEMLYYLYILLRSSDFKNITASEEAINLLFGIKKNTTDILLKILKTFGFITDDFLLPASFFLDFEALLPESIKRHIDTVFENFIVQKLRDNSIYPTIDILQYTGINISEEFIIQCVVSLAQRPDYDIPESAEGLPEQYKLIADFYSALAHSDVVQSQNALIALKKNSNNTLTTIINLMDTEYAFASASITEGYANARKALLSIREQTNPKLKSRIHRLMGLLCFITERETEGSEFLNNAGSFAVSCRDIQEQCCVTYKKSIEEYIFYSLSQSMYYAKECQTLAENISRPDYLIAAKSLQGRINFDLGLYDDSAQLFLQASMLASQYSLEDARVRSALWHARALAYCGRIPEARSILDQWNDDNEALFFIAETELLRENYSAAYAILENEPHIMPKPFIGPDTIAWSSLFQEIEGTAYDFTIACGPLYYYYQFFKTYLSVLHIYSSTAKTNYNEIEIQQAIMKLQEMVKQHKAISEGPYAPQFLYWIYETTELFPFFTIDKQTALSRAFKAFQKRSGKIDDRTSRNLYMNKNRWNQKILEAAQRYHFI